MSVKKKLVEIRDLIAQDPELTDAFKSGFYAQRAAHLITQMREARGWTKAELAQRLGVSAPRISEAENPKGSDGPTYRVMYEVANACGFHWPTSLDDLRRSPSRPRGLRHALGAKRQLAELALARADLARKERGS
jgi:transcriptional regulator with XRE-family HTH domain